MASMIVPANVASDPAIDGALIVAAFTPHECAYCRWPIASGQRWVGEKIYEPFTGNNPCYHRYHSDLFDGQELSCWEKHQMERENARTALHAA
jgi:hypothetical protein